MVSIRKNAGIKKGRVVAPSFAFLLAALAMLTGCKESLKINQQFVNAYVDMRVSDFVYGADTPVARLSRQEILKKYGYSREQFLAETDRLLAEDEKWVEFQKAVVLRIDSLSVVSKVAEESPAPSNGPKLKMPTHKGGVQ